MVGGKSKVMSEPANEFIMGKVGVVGKQSFSVRLGTTPACFSSYCIIIIIMTRPVEHFTHQIPVIVLDECCMTAFSTTSWVRFCTYFVSYLTLREVVGSKPNFDENFFNRLGPTNLFVSVRSISLSIGRKFSRWRQI